MAKWILPIFFLAFTSGCGQQSNQETPSAPASAGKTEPAAGVYTVYDIFYSPVQPTISDPVTWWVGARARCSGCDMTGAFDVGIRVYINGVPRELLYPGSRFTMALGDTAGEFSGMGSANIGSMPPGSYSLTVEVAPRPGFVGQTIPSTISITVN